MIAPLLSQQRMWQALPKDYVFTPPPTTEAIVSVEPPAPLEFNQDWVAIDAMLVFVLVGIFMLPNLPED